ncbi:hypothetical protein AMEX_G6035 [Astyanax mexicanus]|uniref:L1 transposable element RRM domain-containing protein n=1 Tax=Astyanax mexicanus TaxID=7994 RepID=A0A8T2MBH1_ASTMX|nr:hypothetical protein AMEX_G6035 [Astyanax mexicanus]
MASQNINKSLKPKVDSKKKETASNRDHGYAMDISTQNKRERGDSTPPTPCKTPGEKRLRSGEEEEGEEISLRDIMKGIVSLGEKVDSIEQQVTHTSVMLASLAKAVEFNANEVKECKAKVQEMEKQSEKLRKENADLKQRLREQERYRMRWCLRIQGLKEEKGEDIRAVVIQTLKHIVPESAARLEEDVDVVHRLGRKLENKQRNIVVLFTRRSMKEEVWKKSKKSSYCKELGIRFAEMLPKEDWEQRNRLWPQIDEARRAGKVAYFRGPFGYIDGRQIGLEGRHT